MFSRKNVPDPSTLPAPNAPATKLPDSTKIDKYLTIAQNKSDAFNPQR